MPPEFIRPDWPAPANVHALITTRNGGVSSGPYASLNLGDHVGDDPAAVAENRRRLRAALPADPVWLRQMHGKRCVDAAQTTTDNEADAAWTNVPGTVCAVLTADCLPILLCDDDGTIVAAAHAGWRGLATGVIEATVRSMNSPGERLMAWLGPAIGPQHFEVGDEVRACFIAHDPQATAAFVPQGGDKWLCDLYQLARQRLNALGIDRIAGADQPEGRRTPESGDPERSKGFGRAEHFCTVRDAARFYSYRRDGVTGRMASLIWLS